MSEREREGGCGKWVLARARVGGGVRANAALARVFIKQVIFFSTQQKIEQLYHSDSNGRGPYPVIPEKTVKVAQHSTSHRPLFPCNHVCQEVTRDTLSLPH